MLLVFGMFLLTHQRIPSHWTIQRSTRFFTKNSVPDALVSRHNTAEGVFGQICVMEGTVTYYGYPHETAADAETRLIIQAGEFATSPPGYWHRVQLSDDAQFNINFWSATDKTQNTLINRSKSQIRSEGPVA